MNSSSHDFVTVDMPGLKAALAARAQAERVNVSAVVRRAVQRELGLDDASVDSGALAAPNAAADTTAAAVKLSIRLTSAEAEKLAAGAHRTGMSRGAFLAGLLAGVPSLSGSIGSRPDGIAALTASSAELATLTCNIHHLSALLRQGEARAAQEYRRMLDTLADDVRAHLRLAGRVLAELRPARASARGSRAAAHP